MRSQLTVALLAAILLITGPAHAVPTTVKVRLLKSGQPFPGVALGVFPTDPKASGRAETDAAGEATITFERPESERVARVEILQSISERTPIDEIRPRLEAWRAMLREYTFAPGYLVEIPPGASEASLTVEVEPAITAKVELTRDGQPYKDAHPMCPETHPAAFYVREDGVGKAGGLRKGRPSTLFIGTSAGDVLRFPLPASDRDIDLGTIAIPGVGAADAGSARIVAHRTKTPPRGPRLRPGVGGVTLVSADGSRIFSFMVRPDKKTEFEEVNYATVGWLATAAGHPDGLPRLPPGRYYALHGAFTAQPEQVHLVERALRGDDLAAAGVPSITIASGQQSTLEFESGAAEAAVMSDVKKPE